MDEIFNLKRKVEAYKEVLQNTLNYRQEWKDSLKDYITGHLETLIQSTGLQASLTVKSEVDNLEAIVLSLGEVESGITRHVNERIGRQLIKHNGSLIYQQLFNGKIIVLIQYPMIENYGEPKPPKTIEIYRPEELKPPYFIRHLEEFIKEITNWEDYDDDEPHKKIGFNLNFEKNGK